MKLAPYLDAVLLDIGGTLVVPASPETPVADLRVQLLPGTAEGLARLWAEVPLAAVTNTAVMKEEAVRSLLAEGGIEAPFSAVVTSADVGREKPDPAPVHEALRRLGGITPQRALLVGDTDADRLAARAAGCGFAPISEAGLWEVVQGWLQGVAGRRFGEALAEVREPDAGARAEAEAHQLLLTKPPGSLGTLERLGNSLAALAGECPPPRPAPAVLTLFAADHGVARSGVTPWPQEVTGAMVANFCAGGAAVNVLARQAGVEVVVVDVGMVGPAVPGALNRRVADGTADLSVGAAMTPVELQAALDVGAEMAARAVGRGGRCLLTGEMGIGNTTSSAALIAAFTGAPAAEVTGRGTGIDDRMLKHKTEIVEQVVARVAGVEPMEVLRQVGGLEIAALAGYAIAGAAEGVPVVLDGVIAGAAAVAAERLRPGVSSWFVAGHLSTEPGARVALEFLGLRPLLDLDLRLGEGTGAVLAYPLVRSAAALLAEMATFETTGIVGPTG